MIAAWTELQGGGDPWYDVSGRDLHGALTNAPVWETKGIRTSPATSTIELGSSPILRDLPLGSWSLRLVVTTHEVGPSHVSFAWSGTDDLLIYANNSISGSGGVRVFWRDMGTLSEVGSDYTDIRQDIVITFDAASGVMVFYRDGAVVITTAPLSGTPGPFTDVRISGFTGGSDQQADQTVHHVAVWDLPLTANTVADLYARPNAEFTLRSQVQVGVAGAPPAPTDGVARMIFLSGAV
jgi:hypothetical protein